MAHTQPLHFILAKALSIEILFDGEFLEVDPNVIFREAYASRGKTNHRTLENCHEI